MDKLTPVTKNENSQQAVKKGMPSSLAIANIKKFCFKKDFKTISNSLANILEDDKVYEIEIIIK